MKMVTALEGEFQAVITDQAVAAPGDIRGSPELSYGEGESLLLSLRSSAGAQKRLAAYTIQHSRAQLSILLQAQNES